MKFHPKKLICLLVAFFLIPLKISPAVLIQSIPYILQITKQALLSFALIAGYLLNVKPEFPSQADPVSQSQEIHSTFLNQLLQNVSKQTGMSITSEVLKQLNHAGIHHDYKKLENLLAELRPIKDGITHETAKIVPSKSEINPYEVIQGIQRFKKQNNYPHTAADTTFLKPSITRPDTFDIKSATLPPCKALAFSNQSNNSQYSNEFATQSQSQSLNPTLILQTENHTKNQNSAHYINQLQHQHALYAQGKAIHEWQKAYSSVASHFMDADLRQQLHSEVRKYQKVLTDACQGGISAKTMEAQTQIALQGLPLPGFLNEFSEVLQEKISRISFRTDGHWKGAESAAQLEELKKACQAYQNLLDTLSDHLRHDSSLQSQECIQELYLMDQGRGTWASRFFSWMNDFFDENAISIEELKNRIAHNSFNQHALAACELLEKNELKLARVPLEDMARSARTPNGVLLNQNLFEQYQQKVALHYGTANIPLKYQTDPVFWLYKPAAEHMQFDDPVLQSMESHLAIRDTICEQILKTVCKKQTPTPFIRTIAYNLIDKLQDPVAVINQLEFLSTDSQNPDIQQACNAFYDKGVLNLFGLTKQASAYRIPVSELLNRSEYAHTRTAFNKLLLIDTRTEQGKNSLQLAFSCLPHACSKNEFSKEYQNIIQAITQAHIDPKASKGILQITSIPFDTSSDFQRTILKAMGKAAQEDISGVQSPPTCPLNTQEAWACIKKVQDLEKQGDSTQAQALANTYLKGYLDEQMPVKQYIKPVIIAAATATAATWWANSGVNPRPRAYSPDESSFFQPHNLNANNADTEDDQVEEVKEYSPEEIFNGLPREGKTKGKSKIADKKGNLPSGNQEPENDTDRKKYEHINNKEADEVAKELGFNKIGEKSHGRPIYKKGNRYISPEQTRHNGGFWKMADSVQALAKRNTRMGTYDRFLNRIGD